MIQIMVPLVMVSYPVISMFFAQVDPGTLTSMIERGGVVALLVFILIAFIREWVFTGAAYRRKESEAEEWKKIALASMNVTDKAVTMVERP